MYLTDLKSCYSGGMTNITNVLTGRSIKEWTMEPGRPLEKQKEKGKTQ